MVGSTFWHADPASGGDHAILFDRFAANGAKRKELDHPDHPIYWPQVSDTSMS